MKIYDCFPIFNEMDLLEIRLELMYGYVDHFIISECDYTFSGLKKPFYFEENKERFSKYLDKIIHIKHYDTDNYTDLVNTYDGRKREIYQNIINRLNEMRDTAQTDYGAPHWCRDYLHKELTMMAMDVCLPDDLILFGDLDEIPNPSKVKFDGNTYLLNQKNMLYYVNIENSTETWFGTYICKFSEIMEESCMFTREKRFSFEKIDNAGWHLTFMGGKERVIEKLKSYSHQEFNNDRIINQVGSKMDNNQDILNRGVTINKISMDEYYPEKMVQFINEKFKYLINE